MGRDAEARIYFGIELGDEWNTVRALQKLGLLRKLTEDEEEKADLDDLSEELRLPEGLALDFYGSYEVTEYYLAAISDGRAYHYSALWDKPQTLPEWFPAIDPKLVELLYEYAEVLEADSPGWKLAAFYG